MELKLRSGKPEDAETCGQICYEAFAAIAKVHNYCKGQVVGSNFLDERSPVVGVGPITVDPAIQVGGVGRALMQDVMRRATERAVPGIRARATRTSKLSSWLPTCSAGAWSRVCESSSS